MFVMRMIVRSCSRQLRRRLLIALTVCLSAAVSTAMLGVVFDVGDKLNAELSTYGSNIIVQPKADALVDDLYAPAGASSSTGAAGSSSSSAGSSGSVGSTAADPTAFLRESDAATIKTIFWAFNITDFAPRLDLHADAAAGTASADGIPVVGTWFDRKLDLATGETTVVGVSGMRSWWTVDGRWATDGTDEAMIGKDLAAALGVTAASGGTVTLTRGDTSMDFTIVGVYDSGDDENGAMYVSSSKLQDLSGLTDAIDRIEVKALTTPENDLARKAAKNPNALTQEEWETWYCTAYPSSIAYQIEEVLPGAVAKQVRQVAALQGDVLTKTRAVMILMTALSLVAAAIAVANLMAASIDERRAELALLKALGATDGAVSRLMLAETALIASIGALAGVGVGTLVAQLIGHVVFDSGITMRPMVFVLVAVLLAATVLAASLSSIRSILGLRPAEVLHGR